MYVKNLDPPSQKVHYNYEALRKYKKYPLPYGTKFVAWFILIAGIISSSVVLVLYGLSFGIIKSYLWFTGFLLSFILSLLVISPIRIFLFAIIMTFLVKRKPLMVRRKVPTLLLTNPENEEKKNQILKFRRYNANLYKPTSLCKLQNRADDIKYNLELRNLTINVILYFAFMLTAAFVVLFNKSAITYYTNDVITEVFLKGNYTNSVSFMDVYTHEMLSYYLKETLLPALFPTKDPTVKKGILERGWTANPHLKLLGKPRIRQVRVRSDNCRELSKLKGRNLECSPELTLFNEETRDFSLHWRPPPPKGLTDAQASPWRYQTGFKSATIPILGKFSLYFPGGYILELARNFDDALVMLKYMDTFQWIDIRTRAVFIEFTLYCVNTNLFSVVTIIAEAPASGYIIPSYQIETSTFLIMTSEIEFYSFIMLGLFSVTLTILIFRESFRIHRTSFKFYIRSPSASFDLVIIIIGLISLLFDILKSKYVSKLLKKLEKSDNNVFVSFYYAVEWDAWSTYVDAVLVCMAPFKLFQLLTFKVSFFQINYILKQCYKLFLNLWIQELILIIAFSLFFYIHLVKYSEGFSSVTHSLSTTIGRSAGLDDKFDFSLFLNHYFILVPIIFLLFIFLIPICFLNIFIAVVCLYFNKIRNTSFFDKYNLSDYLKYCLTSRNQNDILHLRNVHDLIEKSGSAVMRLKGGGNINEKRRYCKIKKKPPKTVKVLLRDFVTKKRCDLVRYLDLRVERNLALKKMMLTLISEDENVTKESSLLTLYYSFITEKRKLYYRSGGYFFAFQGNGKEEIIERKLFSRIKRIIEDLGRERSIIEEDDEICEEVDSFEAKLSLLHRKIYFLLKKLGSK